MYLNKEVEYAQWNDDDGKSGRGNDDNDKGTENTQRSEEEGAYRPRNDLINCVDVL